MQSIKQGLGRGARRLLAAATIAAASFGEVSQAHADT